MCIRAKEFLKKNRFHHFCVNLVHFQVHFTFFHLKNEEKLYEKWVNEPFSSVRNYYSSTIFVQCTNKTRLSTNTKVNNKTLPSSKCQESDLHWLSDTLES